MFTLVRVVAAWLERADGAVLIAQRASPPAFRGWWELPGGKIEPGETDAVCLVREISEELGVEIEVGAPLITVFHDDARKLGDRRIAISVYAARIVVGEVQCREHLALAWVSRAAMVDYPLLPADLIVLKMFDDHV